MKLACYYFSWFCGLTGLSWVILTWGLSCCWSQVTPRQESSEHPAGWMSTLAHSLAHSHGTWCSVLTRVPARGLSMCPVPLTVWELFWAEIYKDWVYWEIQARFLRASPWKSYSVTLCLLGHGTGSDSGEGCTGVWAAGLVVHWEGERPPCRPGSAFY